MTYGTYQWLLTTDGKMTPKDLLEETANAVRIQALRKLKPTTQIINILSPDQVLPPQTPTTRAAEALCRSSSSPALVNHCLRSYFWARFLCPDLSFDDEALYVAILLHDLGISGRFTLPSDDPRCFTIVGCEQALKLCLANNWPQDRAHLVADAIALHLNVVIPESQDSEALMTRIGAGADVAGIRLDELPQSLLNATLTRHPTGNLREELIDSLSREINRCPHSRTAFMFEKLAFKDRIKVAQHLG